MYWYQRMPSTELRGNFSNQVPSFTSLSSFAAFKRKPSRLAKRK